MSFAPQLPFTPRLRFRGFQSGATGSANSGEIIAAPANMRAEAIGIGQVLIRWVPNGLNTPKLYRSTDQINYIQFTPDSTLTPTSTKAVNSGLADATRYFYKSSNDNGLSFSTIASVVTYVVNLPRRRANASVFNAYDN